jgi:heme/copper-type cytochrome/quinol oxidase subunit 4
MAEFNLHVKLSLITHRLSSESRKGGVFMKKGFLLIIIILLVIYGSFGAADLSEAKGKLSKIDQQVLDEFNLSLKDSSEGRFQAVKMDDTSILIIDTRLGHLWVFRTSPEVLVKWAGKVKPGTSFWKTILRTK